MNILQKLTASSASANALFYSAALVGAAATGGLFAADTAHAQAQVTQQSETVSIRSEIFVERAVTENGAEKVELLNPKKVTVIPGDKLIIINYYENESALPRENYVATNPLHPAIAFVAAEEEWAQVSVDGGKTWGKLPELVTTITPADGIESQSRPAAPGDVTHVRWRFSKPLAPGEKGKLTFRGVVR